MLTEFVIAFALGAAPAGDVEKLGKVVASDLAAGRDGLTPVLSLKELIDRTFEGIEAPPDFRRGFEKGAGNSINKIGESLSRAAQSGARITFRKVVTLDSESAAQLRLLFPDGTFNILELMVKSDADGRLKVVDFYDLVAGELKSQEMRRFALTFLAEQNLSILDRVMGKDEIFIKNVPQLKAYLATAREGRYAEVVQMYKSLPKEVQQQRTILRIYAVSAGKVDDNEYERALGSYLALYPDASSHMMAIDYFFLKKEWAKLDRSLDIVEKRVGADDAWFEVLRGDFEIVRGNSVEAKNHFMLAIDREKTLRDPYFMLLGISLREKNFADTAKWLTALERDAGIPLKDVSTLPAYSEFAASKEGKAYIEMQRSAKKH